MYASTHVFIHFSINMIQIFLIYLAHLFLRIYFTVFLQYNIDVI